MNYKEMALPYFFAILRDEFEILTKNIRCEQDRGIDILKNILLCLSEPIQASQRSYYCRLGSIVIDLLRLRNSKCHASNGLALRARFAILNPTLCVMQIAMTDSLSNGQILRMSINYYMQALSRKELEVGPLHHSIESTRNFATIYCLMDVIKSSEYMLNAENLVRLTKALSTIKHTNFPRYNDFKVLFTSLNKLLTLSLLVFNINLQRSIDVLNGRVF